MPLEIMRAKRGGNRSLQATQVKTRSFCLIQHRNETRGMIKRQRKSGLSDKPYGDLCSCMPVEHEQGETAILEKDAAEIQGHWSLDAGFICEDE